MESAAVNMPPAWLERAAQALVPPAAREAVMGDLCETYIAPAHFAAEAARILPFVIASQARRNANLPALGLQGFLAFFCVRGLTGDGRIAVAAALAILLAVLVKDAYQPLARQACAHAMREAVLVALAMVVLAQTLAVRMEGTRLMADVFLWSRMGFLVPALFPALCLFRAVLIVGNDRLAASARNVPGDALDSDYRRFARRMRRTNALAALVSLVLAWQAFIHRAGLDVFPAAVPGLISVYVIAAVYLLLDRPLLPGGDDAVSLRALYRQELARQLQLRRFLCWLWAAPLLMAAQAWLVAPGLAAGRSIVVAYGVLAMAGLGFAVRAVSREQAGRVQEKIGLLERI